MNTLRLKMTTSFGLMLGLLAGAVPLVWAEATGEMEYRFEHMMPYIDMQWGLAYDHIAGAPDGTFWIYGRRKNYIHHFNADGILIRAFYMGDQNSIEYLTVAADGSVWTKSYHYNNNMSSLQHYQDDGKLITEAAVSGYGNLAVAGDGNLWFKGEEYNSSSERNEPMVYHLNVDGSLIKKFAQPDAIDIGINNIAAGLDGSVWLVDNSSNIFHLTENGALIAKFNPAQLGLSTSYIDSFVTAVDGSFWIQDNSVIYHFSANGVLFKQLPSPGVMVSAVDGSLWVFNAYEGVIQHLDKDGSLINQLGHFDDDSGQLSPGKDIELADDGSLWRIGGNGIQHLDKDGLLIGQIILQNPAQDISKATDGSFWVLSGAILHYSAEGILINQFRPEVSTSKPEDYVQMTTAIAAAPDGGVWVAEKTSSHGLGHNRIQHFSADGTFISKIDDIHVSDIAVSNDGSVWGVGGVIYHFTADGVLIGQVGTHGKEPGQLNYPSDIAIAADGHIWVMDYPRVMSFSVDGEFITQFETVEPNVRVTEDYYFYNTAYPNFDVSGYYLTLGKDGVLWTSEGTRLQKFVPHPKAKTAHPYKAIILAGNTHQGNDPANDFFEGACWQLAQKANQALQRQGFKIREGILFLTAGSTQVDLDYNGVMDDLQAATKDSLRLAITDWAKDSTDVVLYLAGSASAGQFQLNATETFTAQELAGWLADLENKLPTNGKVTVVIEAPDAGSFVSGLANPHRPRYVVASTQAGQPALMADHGVNSFSYTFWSRVMDGAPLAETFLAGQQAVGSFAVDGQALQPTGDANGNGQADAQDAVAVGNYCLGMCNKTATQLPAINLPGQPSLAFKAANSLDFNVNVRPAANTHLLETWALVQRPAALGADPANALSLEKIPLNCDSSQHCTGRYGHFDTPGQYRVHFYALDSQYQLNAPAFLDITIQPENTSTLPAEYDSRQGLLTLHDVEVSAGQHYQAALQYQDGLYYLLTLGLTPNVLNPSARFDAATNLLDIPLARVNGQDYQGSFRLVDNYLFELLAATPKRVSTQYANKTLEIYNENITFNHSYALLGNIGADGRLSK